MPGVSEGSASCLTPLGAANDEIAGDQAGDFRGALISGTLIFIAIGFHIHEMNLIAPLSDKACARPD
jgi:hypothetical protein